MIRQDIILADYSSNGKPELSHKYIVDLYKAGIDIRDDIRAQYVMLRRYDVINEVVYDTDVYLVDRSLVDDYQKIVWPMANGAFTGFSGDPQAFNENFTSKVIGIGKDETYDIVEFDGNEHHIANVPCDILRVYHPHNQKKLQGIVYCDALVGNTKFHILCKLWEDGEIRSSEDFTIDGVHYSEYREYKMPSLEWLMSGNAWYEERITLVKAGLRDGAEDLSGFLRTPDNGMAEDGAFLSLEAYKIPFLIVTENEVTEEGQQDVFFKKFITDLNDSVAQDYVEFPIRVTLAPYTTYDSSSSIYINEDKTAMNSDVMQYDASMTLAACLKFDNSSVPSLIASFQFPGKDNFSTFREAYEHYYRVDLNDYTGIVEYDEEDEDDDDYVEQKQCGFMICIYSDYDMQSLIMKEYYEIDDPENQLSDFAFQLSGIFTNWDELPDTLVMQARFIDKWLGNIIVSNPVTVTEDMFKYLVNEDSKSIVKWENEEEKHYHKDDMDLSSINFIDKIVCTINKKTDDTNTINGASNGPRVLYKPVFYRVQDLQHIQIRSGLTQNIGIVLADYMTKVESFKMIIAGTEIVESARNDVYAIFSVPGGIVEGTNSGTYHIATQDGEYISSGTYETIQ